MARAIGGRSAKNGPAGERPVSTLISCANRGICRHLAIELAAAGHDVALLGRRPDALARPIARQLPLIMKT